MIPTPRFSPGARSPVWPCAPPTCGMRAIVTPTLAAMSLLPCAISGTPIGQSRPQERPHPTREDFDPVGGEAVQRESVANGGRNPEDAAMLDAYPLRSLERHEESRSAGRG